MSTFSWKFSGLDTNGKPWTAFEYWLLYVQGEPHSALPPAAVTPAYVPGVSTTYTCDLTKIDAIANLLDLGASPNPAYIAAGTYAFSAAAVGGGQAGLPSPTVNVTYAPPTAVVTTPPTPPVPATPVAANAVP